MSSNLEGEFQLLILRCVADADEFIKLVARGAVCYFGFAVQSETLQSYLPFIVVY